MEVPSVAVCRSCGAMFGWERGTRRICVDCRPGWEAKQRSNAPHHHRPESRAAMKAVAAAAEADPTVMCHLCVRRDPPPGYDATWTADHDLGELKPAHRGCNSAKGARTAQWFRQRLAANHPKWFE